MKKILDIFRIYFNIALLALFKKLPVSSAVIGPAKGHYPTVKSWFVAKSNCHKKSSNTYFEIYLDEKPSIPKLLPKTVTDNCDSVFYDWQTLEYPPAFLATISQGRVVGICDSILTPDDYLLEEVSAQYGSITYHPALSSLRLPFRRKIQAPVVAIAVPDGLNYYHWLFDVLPRIHIVQKSGLYNKEIAKIYTNPVVGDFQKDTLKILGVSQQQILEAHPGLQIQAKQLLLPSLPGVVGNPPRWVCDFLRHTFLSAAVESNKGKYLYISRCKARHRRVLNENDVIEILHQRGFTVVNLEDFSFREQVGLFSTAHVVIAPHGAGLANLVFCQPQTKVIEIFSPNYVCPFYWNISNQINLDYYYLLGEGEKHSEKSYDITKLGENITVDLQDLVKVLELSNLSYEDC